MSGSRNVPTLGGVREAVLRSALVLFALLTLSGGCEGPHEETHDLHEEDHETPDGISLSPEAVEAAGIVIDAARPGRQVRRIRVTGTLSYDERAMAIATARVGGRITKVIGDYGQEVSEGEALAWIDSPQLGAAQAEYLRAQSMSQLRGAEYERAQLLLQGEAISRGELLRREAEWRAAEAELRTAEQQLHILGLSQGDVESLLDGRSGAGHEYPVRAPIRGRVTERRAVQGRVVAADNELFTVARLDSLWLFLQIFEKDLPVVQEGTHVTLTCESHPDHHFAGTIDFVGQVLDPHSRTVQARAVIKNPERKLKPGMFVYATIETSDEHDEGDTEGLSIPLEAVAKIDDGDVVFVETAERTFEVRPVTLGSAGREDVEVLEGLVPGERIAVKGVFVLKSEILKGGLEGHDH
jgi:cobalt-zinc-cadmium efflux system membrane fusion protein